MNTPDGQGRTYHILTYGCQMNQNDSERLSGLLENTGWVFADKAEGADLVILNTCSIRDKSERRVSGKLHELNWLRKQNGRPGKLAITGCMPQHMRTFVLEELPFLDVIVGVNNMEMLPTFLTGNVSLEQQLKALRPNRKETEVAEYEAAFTVQRRAPGEKAWVSIAFGCDKFCTYCIVPFTRGREYSRKKEAILKEIAELEAQGYHEVVLLGQNVNSYGKTTYKDYLFPDLLRDVSAQKFLTKIEFLTSHPRDVDEHLIHVIAEGENISKEIHFPMQHGDDEILERMNRGYTYAEYLGKVHALRRRIPGARVGTDLIVGFPGETEEKFRTLVERVKEVGFDWANVAAFSPRPGTKAATWPGQLPEPVKLERLNFMLDLLRKMSAANRSPIVPPAPFESRPQSA